MSESVVCQKCGIQRPSDSPFGLCPSCLLKAGLEGATISFGPATTSVFAAFGEAFGNIPPILLRDLDSAGQNEPVTRASSAEFADAKNRMPRLQMFGEIARGGMGAVLKGRDADLGRELAVKVLLESHKDKPDMVRRFVEEAQIAGQLQHPGIVPVYELGALGDQRPYFAMKLVKGDTLAAFLSKRKTSSETLPRLLTILESICQTMAYAHARGVIHRDLKPSNVMVGSFGEVQVMDWGLAKVLPQGGVSDDADAGRMKDEATVIATARTGSDVGASMVGSIMGTPAYMAPEQARGEVDQLDQRVDVFAIGSIFCEMLTGQPAFLGRNTGEIQRKAARGDLSDALSRLDELDLGYDKQLIDLAKACLSAEREDRPRDAGEIAERLSEYQAHVQTRLRQSEIERAEEKARAIEAAKRANVERQRLRLAVALAASILGFVVLSGAGLAFVSQQRAVRQSATERAVSEWLDKANLLHGQAVAAPIGDLTKWTEALAAANQAEGILKTGEPSDSLRTRAAELVGKLKNEHKQAITRAAENEKDEQLIARLDAIGLKYADADKSRDDYLEEEQDGVHEANQAYAAAFLEFGVDMDRLSASEAASLLRQRSRPEEFASRLDSWALIRKSIVSNKMLLGERPQQSDETWKRLVAIAQAIDDDPWRNSIRSLIGHCDVPTVLKFARNEDELANQPSRSLYLLALVLEDARGRSLYWRDRQYLADTVRLLKRAWLLDPSNFQVCRKLSTSCPDEFNRLRFATAAVTAAPQHSAARQTLLECLLPSDDESLLRKVELVEAGEMSTEAPEDAITFKYPNGDAVHFWPKRYEPMEDKHKLSEAIDLLRISLKSDPSLLSNYESLALALVRNSQPEEAVVVCRTIEKLDPTHRPSDVIGRTLYGMDQLDLAIDLFNKEITDDPNGDHDFATLGAIHYERGNRDKAFQAFQHAFVQRLNDSKWDDGVFRHNHGYISKNVPYETMGSVEDVVATYKKSVELHPDSDSHWLLAKFLRREGRIEEAIAVCSVAATVLSYNRTSGGLMDILDLGTEILLDTNRSDEAISLVMTAVTRDPNNAELRRVLARLYRKAGRAAERMEELKRLAGLYQDELKNPPKRYRCFVHDDLADMYEALGNPKEARIHRLLSLKTGIGALGLNSLAMDWSASNDEQYRDGELAVVAATRACELTGWGNSMILDTLATAYAETGDFESAVKWQLSAIQLLQDKSWMEEYESNLKLYQQKMPFRYGQ